MSTMHLMVVQRLYPVYGRVRAICQVGYFVYAIYRFERLQGMQTGQKMLHMLSVPGGHFRSLSSHSLPV